MRLGLTLTRTGNTWKVEALPSVPLADQLAAFKAKQVGEGFDGVEEVLVVSLGDTIKRHLCKAKPAPAVEVEAEEESPKPKKK
jgi:hypothetical protein